MNIQCPHCESECEASNEHYGTNVACPSCKKNISIPDPEAKKRCPFCSETILKTANKCKHCGEFLNKPPPISKTDTKGQDIIEVKKENVLNRNRGCGDIVIFGPVILIVIIVILFMSKGCG